MQVFNIDKKLLKAAAYATETDDPRPINGVFLDKEEGKINKLNNNMSSVLYNILPEVATPRLAIKT